MRIRKTSQYIEGGATLPNYSLEEINTGSTWIDGKPLYRRVFETTTLGSSEVIVYTIVNEKIKRIEGWLFNDNGFVQPYGSYQNDATRASRVFCDGSYVKVQQNTNYQDGTFKARVVIEYTKTTD